MESLSGEELVRLVQRVFRPRGEDRALAVLVDLPDERVGDNPDWERRREMAHGWWKELDARRAELGLEAIRVVYFRNAHSNNADFPEDAWLYEGGQEPRDADAIRSETTSFDTVLDEHDILLAPTEFSATAPLKVAARRFGFRAATMPGFSPDMIPALRLDYGEIDKRCREVKGWLDAAERATLRMEAGGEGHELVLDLRHRSAHASGGLLSEPGTAGNLPSGETYIVPYEGELANDPSRTRGSLPLELDGELMSYTIEGNRVVLVVGDGPRAGEERKLVRAEPAYANIAELGIGVLADYGVKPVGELLLDEKLGLHVALGRSDHFGGNVGPKDFSSPDRVVHIDRVYIPEVQPNVTVHSVELSGIGGARTLIRDGKLVR